MPARSTCLACGTSLDLPDSLAAAPSFCPRCGQPLAVGAPEAAAPAARRVVAVHQPNFLPWLGFLQKVVRADLFVLYDDVQFPASPTFGNRVTIKTHQGPLDVVVPVSASRTDLFNQVRLAPGNWRKKTVKTIQLEYQRAPFTAQYLPAFAEVLMDAKVTSLCEMNRRLLELVLEKLGAPKHLVWSSETGEKTAANGGERLLEILRRIEATHYISGQGAGSQRYVRDEDFQKAGIHLIWQKFAHPTYTQLHGEFVPNLSCLDLLFNCGPASLDVLMKAEGIAL